MHLCLNSLEMQTHVLDINNDKFVFLNSSAVTARSETVEYHHLSKIL
jgi:hypothetical protein